MKLMTLLNTFLTIVLTGRPILAPPTRLLTSRSQPAGRANTGPVTGLALGEVLTGTDAVAATAVGVDGAGTVAVISGVARLADTLPSPRVTPLVQFLIILYFSTVQDASTKQNFYDYDFRIDGWAGWQWAKSMFPTMK